MTRFRLKVQPIVDLEENLSLDKNDFLEVNIGNEPSSYKTKLKTLLNLIGDIYLSENYPARHVGSVLICNNTDLNKEIGVLTFNPITDNGKVLTIDNTLPLNVAFKTVSGGNGSGDLLATNNLSDVNDRQVSLNNLLNNSNNITTAGRITFNNSYTNLASFPSNSTYKGITCFSIADNANYVSGLSSWEKLVTSTNLTSELNNYVNYQQFVEVTGNYTLLNSDHGKIVIISNTSTVSLPTNFLAGYQVTVLNYTNSVITFSTTGTLISKTNTCKNQYGAVYLTYKGSNQWIALGDLS